MKKEKNENEATVPDEMIEDKANEKNADEKETAETPKKENDGNAAETAKETNEKQANQTAGNSPASEEEATANNEEESCDTKQVEALTTLLEQSPELADILILMLSDRDMPLRRAIRSALSKEDLAAQPGDEEWDEQQQHHQLLENNLNESENLLDRWCSEKKISEEEHQALIAAINSDYENLTSNRVTPEMLEGYFKRIAFERLLEEARQSGEVEGRNANIEARMKRMEAAQLGDGLPHPTHEHGAVMLRGNKPVIDFSKF